MRINDALQAERISQSTLNLNLPNNTVTMCVCEIHTHRVNGS